MEAAASVSSRTVSAFVLEVPWPADEALADRRTFHLSKAKWTEFLAALDADPPLPQMQRLLAEPGFFDATPAPGFKEKR
ncbi:MAG: DUF1778 domain-containing protein [Nitrospira sp.]|nr:DUF1778 domain-containing protein [Nitrospira sp.]